MNNKERVIKKAIQAVLENAFNTAGVEKLKINYVAGGYTKCIDIQNIHVIETFIDTAEDTACLLINNDLNFTPKKADEFIYKGVKYKVNKVSTDQENVHFTIIAKIKKE